jgi:protein O-mannosyl-transferase
MSPSSPAVAAVLSERARPYLLLALSLLVYANTLANGFTYDDEGYILRSQAVQTFSLARLFGPTSGNHIYRPFAFSTFAMNWSLSGAQPFSYHLVNIFLHAAVCLLLYFVLKTLLAAVPQGEIIAFAAALLFAAHPIHTEAVASIVGRSELLAAGFLLAAWLLHLQDRPIPSLLCFALAMLSKESAVVFLPLALLGDYAIGKLKSLSRYISIAAVTALYVALLWTVQGHHFDKGPYAKVDNPLASLPTLWRVLNAIRIAWKYIGIQLYPATLSYDYSFDAIPLYRSWTHTLPAASAALIVLSLWLWSVRAKRSSWMLAGAIYFVGFAITSNILLPTGTVMGERLAYLPSAGFCLLIALIWALLEGQRQTFAWALLLCAVTALSLRTIVRNLDWRDNPTLYARDIHAVPNSVRAHLNLGDEFLRRGQVKYASAQFQQALYIDPDSDGALERYGMTEAVMGQNQQASADLGKALALAQLNDPNYDLMAWNLATVLTRSGQDDEALKVLNREIDESRGSTRVWSTRAVIRYRKGELDSARTDATQALRLDPTNTQAQTLLGELNKNAPAY